ncbi:MAG TPA: PfkB family carbohydrate kinase, partial [Ilumatobacteraceae bacterium]
MPGPGETVLGAEYHEYPGGKGLNQAVAAARAGARTSFVAAVGTDAAGARLVGVAVTAGIDVGALIRDDDAPTGRALIGVSATGENSIIVVPGANARLEADDVHLAAAAASVVLAQLEVPLPTVRAALRAARAAGAITILNPAPAAALDADTLSLCDVVIPNEHEAELLGGVDALLGGGARAVVMTMGGRGAQLRNSDGTVATVAAFAVTPVDTTAAGDAFCGAFAA